jgi:large subunit ribosomal protein L22
MTTQGYAFQGYNKEKMARVLGRTLEISTKQSINICNQLRGKPVERAKRILGEVLTMKKAMPYTRFNKDIGHKPGVGPGRYPQNASKKILELLDAVEANAQNKGLDTNSLVIKHICAHKGTRIMHHGRSPGTKRKSTHIEIVVEEMKKIDKDKTKGKEKKTEKAESKDKTVKQEKETVAKKEIQDAKSEPEAKETKTKEGKKK